MCFPINFLFWCSAHWCEWGVKVFYYCVTGSFSFYVCKCFVLFFYVMRCSYVGWWIFIIVVFLLDWSLDHYVVFFLISCNFLYFKVYFVCYENCYSSSLLLPICKEYIFPSSHFQSMCLEVWSGFLVDDIYMDLVLYPFSQSVSLVGAFNPFTFKVIIDIFIPIAIF